MREIKFRLRVGNRIVGFEKWYPGAGLAALPRWLYSKDGKYWNPDYIFHDSKDQFTGLHDCRKKEIYEGDIVYRETLSRDDPALAGRYGDTGEAEECLGVYRVRFVEKWEILSVDLNAMSLEVIGNIYENGELLGEKP